MGKRRKKRARRILAIGISCSIIFTFISGLAVLAPISVYAANPFQVGAVILSLLTSLNQTPSTGSITNYMTSNSVLSQSITSVEQLEGLDSAIDQALSADLGTARFTAQLSDSAADMKILKETLIGAGADPEKVRLLSDSGATVGQNVKATIKEYLETGELSRSYGGKTLNEIGLQTAFGMTALAYEGAKLGNFQQFQEYASAAGLTQEEIDAAVDSGAAFGDPSAFDDYIKEYRKTIYSGLSIDTQSNVLGQMPDGFQATIFRESDGTLYCFYFPNAFLLRQNTNSNNLTGGGVNWTNFNRVGKAIHTNGRIENWEPTISGSYNYSNGTVYYRNSGNYFSSTKVISTGLPIYENARAASDAFADGSFPGKSSPSVADENGQITSTYDSNYPQQPYIINITPSYNVNNYNINPLPSLQDYSGVVEQLEENVSDNISNEDIVPNFISPYLVPRQVVDPDPEPTSAPNPITPIPSVIPPQPTAAPLPTLEPEDETEIPKYMNQPDLTSKFPFCIPFDLAMIFALFNSNVRQAPVFDWELNFGPAGTYNIHIDFSPYDPAAALFRLLMLIFFVFSLALGTHRLIHPEGS